MKYTRKSYRKRSYKKALPKLKTKVNNTRKTTIKDVQRIVRKEIHKDVETKQAFNTIGSGQSLVNFAPGITNTAGNVNWLIPNIANGTGTNDRIGDKVRPQSIKVSGYVRLQNATGAGTVLLSNVALRMMIVSMKNVNSYDQASSVMSLNLDNLLRRGALTSPFKGYLEDLHSPINTEIWTVHKNRVIYLNQPNMASLSGQQDLQNTVRFFSYTQRFKNKQWRYDDSYNADLLPTNQILYCLMGYVYLNGSTPTTTANMGVYLNTVLNYEDA